MSPTDAADALRTLGFYGIADAVLDPTEALDAVYLRMLVDDVWWGFGHVGSDDERPIYRLAAAFILSIEPY